MGIAPTNQLPTTCSAPCPHGGHSCFLSEGHGEGFSSSIPGDEATHACFQCNCTWGPFLHIHDGMSQLPSVVELKQFQDDQW